MYKQIQMALVTVLGGGHEMSKYMWDAPTTHERTVMRKKCGKKCFLGPKKSFPVCDPGTCKVNPRGVHAAYVRAREYSSKKMHRRKTVKHATRKAKSTYRKIAASAKRLLRKFKL